MSACEELNTVELRARVELYTKAIHRHMWQLTWTICLHTHTSTHKHTHTHKQTHTHWAQTVTKGCNDKTYQWTSVIWTGPRGLTHQNT